MAEVRFEFFPAALTDWLADPSGGGAKLLGLIGTSIATEVRDTVHVAQGPGGGQLRDSIGYHVTPSPGGLAVRVGPRADAPPQADGTPQDQIMLYEELGSKRHGPMNWLTRAMEGVRI